MKIIITGGAGFIGYHLTKNLVKKGHTVVIYDCFTSYIPEDKSIYLPYLQIRLKELKEIAEIIKGDIRDTELLIKTIREHKPEVLINLAAVPIATTSNQMSQEAIGMNLNGVTSILDAIRSTDSVRRFVYISSSFVYGNFQSDPADENHINEPIDVYGGTKMAGEVLVKSFGRRFGIEYTIIRPSAVYGPTDTNRRVSQIFLENAMKGKPLVLHNGGLGKVDFTYATDAAEGFALAATLPAAKNEVFNITRGEGRSMKEFADILKKLLPNVKTEEKPPDEIRPERGSLDISKARKLLGYNPKYSLEDGMKEYVAYVKKTGII